LRQNGGGHFNHTLFWETLSPEGGGKPQGPLLQDLENTFGGFEAFRETFTRANGKQPGHETDPIWKIFLGLYFIQLAE